MLYNRYYFWYIKKTYDNKNERKISFDGSVAKDFPEQGTLHLALKDE